MKKRLLIALLIFSGASHAQMPGVDRIDPQAQVTQALEAFKTPAKAAASGTPMAARQAAVRFVSILYGAPSESVNTIMLEAKGNFATVRTAWENQACTLKLVKNATANELGWVVQEHPCGVVR